MGLQIFLYQCRSWSEDRVFGNYLITTAIMEVSNVVLVCVGWNFMFHDEAKRCKDINDDTNSLWKYSLTLLSFNTFIVFLELSLFVVTVSYSLKRYCQDNDNNKYISQARIDKLIKNQKTSYNKIAMEVRKNDPISPNDKQTIEIQCVICEKAFKDEDLLFKTSCNQMGHLIHKECKLANTFLINLLKDNCNYCKTNNNNNEVVQLYENKDKISVELVSEIQEEKKDDKEEIKNNCKHYECVICEKNKGIERKVIDDSKENKKDLPQNGNFISRNDANNQRNVERQRYKDLAPWRQHIRKKKEKHQKKDLDIKRNDRKNAQKQAVTLFDDKVQATYKSLINQTRIEVKNKPE